MLVVLFADRASFYFPVCRASAGLTLLTVGLSSLAVGLGRRRPNNAQRT